MLFGSALADSVLKLFGSADEGSATDSLVGSGLLISGSGVDGSATTSLVGSGVEGSATASLVGSGVDGSATTSLVGSGSAEEGSLVVDGSLVGSGVVSVSTFFWVLPIYLQMRTFKNKMCRGFCDCFCVFLCKC